MQLCHHILYCPSLCFHNFHKCFWDTFWHILLSFHMFFFKNLLSYISLLHYLLGCDLVPFGYRFVILCIIRVKLGTLNTLNFLRGSGAFLFRLEASEALPFPWGAGEGTPLLVLVSLITTPWVIVFYYFSTTIVFLGFFSALFLSFPLTYASPHEHLTYYHMLWECLLLPCPLWRILKALLGCHAWWNRGSFLCSSSSLFWL